MNKLLYLVGIVLLFTACQGSQPIKAFKDKKDVNTLTTEEQNIWHEAKKFDKQLLKNGSIYTNPEVNSYVQSLIDRLYPEFRGRIHIRLLKDPTLNAFALPNGSIYFNIGLIARLENEAQLVTILGHEAAHFIYKHSLKSRRNIKSASAFGILLSPVIGGFGRLLALSSVSGFSRNLEREADKYAFEKMENIGYDVSQAKVAFKKLLAEAKANKSKRPVFFASHPKLQERINSYKKLEKLRKKSGGEVGEARYIKKTADLRLAVLDADLNHHRYKSIIVTLKNNKNKILYPAFTSYHLGEAYRQRAEKGDEEKAFASYLNSVAKAPKYAPAYRALGVYYMKKKRYQDAKRAFTKFLKLAPNHPKAGYVRHYLKQVNKSL